MWEGRKEGWKEEFEKNCNFMLCLGNCLFYLMVILIVSRENFLNEFCVFFFNNFERINIWYLFSFFILMIYMFEFICIL